MTGLVNPLSGLLVGWQVSLAALVIGAGGGVFATYKVMHNANEAAAAHQAKATVQYVEKAGTINFNLGTLYVPQYILLHDRTAQIQKEIPQHVTPQVDREYPVPLGFVRVFNTASHGPVPGPSAGGDADPSGVPLSDVAQAHAGDEGTLDVCRAQLSEWWDWYDRNKALWNKTGNAISR